MGIYIPNITIEDLKHRPSRFLIGSKGVSLEITDAYGTHALKEEYVVEVKTPHGRLIDAEKLIKDNNALGYRTDEGNGYDRKWAMGFNAGVRHAVEHIYGSRTVVQAEE